MKSTDKYLFNEERDGKKLMLSSSQITQFLKCRKAWSYSYRQNLTTRVERPYLTIGKLCHIGMQYAFKEKYRQDTINKYNEEACICLGKHEINKVFNQYMSENCFLEEEIPMLKQLEFDSEIIFERTFRSINAKNIEVVTINDIPALELHFVIPITRTKYLHGFIDAIFKDKTTGETWIVDYKFRKSLSDVDDEAYNMQNAIYMYAAKYLGVQVNGSVTYQALNQAPTLPTLNKNGTVSRAKIKTDWETYKAFLEIHDQNPDDYAEEMIPKLADIEWFRPIKEFRNEETLERIWHDVVLVAADQIYKAYKLKTDKTCLKSMFPFNCKLCQFAQLCQGELRHYDVEYLKNTVYVNKNKNIEIESDKDILDNPNLPMV